MTATTAVAGQRITAAFLNTNIPGPWVAITPLASWVNVGGVQQNFQARLANSVTIEITASIKSGTTTAGTVIGNIPAGLGLPVSAQNFTCQITAGTGSGGTCTVFITTAGAITLEGTTSGMTALALSISLSLDA